MNNDRYCLVIPHYNQYSALKEFLPKVVAQQMTCILVDDGSDAKVKKRLRARIEHISKKTSADIHLVEHDENEGKGAAVHTGARTARNLEFNYFIQIDADGQHDIKDVTKFIAASKQRPDDIIAGAPTFDETAPKARLYGRKITDFWVAVETLSRDVKDSLCGFRLYPVDQFHEVYDEHVIGRGMSFDTDFLVKAIWMENQVFFIDTKVIYKTDSQSHFHYLSDNLSLIWLHTTLVLGMLKRLPFLYGLRKSGFKAVSNQ